MTKEEGYITNCYIAGRPGDPPLITQHQDGTLTFRMDRYAIFPIEEYEEMKRPWWKKLLHLV